MGSTRKWWGKVFLEALEKFTDSARITRGRAYASNGSVTEFKVEKNKITATVEGSINPYFGVYKTPYYKIVIEMKTISDASWKKVIQTIGSNAEYVIKLLMNEMPETIEYAFKEAEVALLPQSKKDFVSTSCSCPDYAVPCKHIAAVYYCVAYKLDQDPFLLFDLRGLERSKLLQELSKEPLGKILAEQLTEPAPILKSHCAYYPNVAQVDVPQNLSLRQYWEGDKKLPLIPKERKGLSVPASLIKLQSDYPKFWVSNISFIKIMENIYSRIRKKVL